MTKKLNRLSVLKQVIELNRIGKQDDLLNILKIKNIHVLEKVNT